MKLILKKIGVWVLVSVFMTCGLLFNNGVVRAEGYGLTLAPMNQSVVIDPGDSREVSFLMANPSSASESVQYELSVEPFYISDSGDIYYEAESGSGEMVDWVTFDVPTVGTLAPNEKTTISFTIDVPESASAGGQYIAIIITLDSDLNGEEGNSDNAGGDSAISIKEIKRMAHLVYAEITGDTNKKGEILDVSVSSFLFSGNITGSSTVKNLGDVHGTAKYILQVYPLFSDEEVYTNEEDPDTKKVLPDRSVYREISWEETPSIGIFNVVYTVEFEGSTAQVKKMVIICPLWLLFIIIFAIVAIIIWLIMKARARKKE